MATEKPKRRKTADQPPQKYVKATISVDVATHARWAAAAALRGMDRNAFAVAALHEALRGLHIIDRSKSSGHDDPASGERSAP